MIRTTKENIVFSNKFFHVYNNEVIFNEKKEGTHLKVEGASSKDGIGILPVLKNGNIVLIKNFRYAVNDWVYQVIKGGNGTKFENNEDALNCAKEELEEEAAMKFGDIIPLGEFYESPSLISVRGFGFIGVDCEFVKQSIFAEDTEVIDEVMEFDPWLVEDFLKDKKVCSTSLYLIKTYQLLLLKQQSKK